MPGGNGGEDACFTRKSEGIFSGNARAGKISFMDVCNTMAGAPVPSSECEAYIIRKVAHKKRKETIYGNLNPNCLIYVLLNTLHSSVTDCTDRSLKSISQSQ